MKPKTISSNRADDSPNKIFEYAAEVLENFGSKERYLGAVTGYDRVGTTIFIRSGDRTFLAFVDPKQPLKSGDQVTFRIDGLRAVNIQKFSISNAA